MLYTQQNAKIKKTCPSY